MASAAKNGAENLRIRMLTFSLALTVVILLVYWQVQDHEFLVWDDYEYIVENPYVRSGLNAENFIWAFTSTHASNWHPLTWLSHMLDCELYGLNPEGHHLNNLLFHIMNSLLLFLLFIKITDSFWQSAFIAALFALHPLHVESVAWVSERKDVLSTFFWMMTLWAYIDYLRLRRLSTYLLCLLLFALGLMAKPMLVTLPFVLLLLDYWPLCRIGPGRRDGHVRPQTPGFADITYLRRNLRQLIWEKIPFFVLVSASGLVTFFVSKSFQSVAALESLPIGIRISNALVSYAGYIGKIFWPNNLAFFYPHPLGTLSWWQVSGSLLFLMGVSFPVIREAQTRPYLVTGWLWYLGTLVPVIGMLQVGSQAMADRYTYVPLIGLSIMIAWGVPELLSKWHHRRIAISLVAGLVFFTLSVCTWWQIQYWKTSMTLFERALEVTADNYIAHYHLGNELTRQGRPNEAISHYSEALRIKPDHLPSRNNLGDALAQQGKLDEALSQYSVALRINPRDAKTHYSLGNIFSKQGKFNEAIACYSEALRMDPGDGTAHNNLGYVLLRTGEPREAMKHFSEALRIDPSDKKARHNLALALKEVQGSDGLMN